MSQYGSAKYGSYLYGSALEHPYARVSGRVMWVVQVDWEREGSFTGGAIESQAISSLKIKRGRGRRLRADGRQFHPGNEEFEIEVIDPAGRYDSFNSSSPIYNYIGAPGLLLRVLIIDTTSKMPAESVFTGTLTSAEWDTKTGVSVLRGEGLSRYLELGQAAALYAPCQSFSNSAWDSYFVSGSSPVPVNYWKGRTGGLTLRACAAIILARAGWLLGSYYGQMVYNNEQPDYFYLYGSSAWDTLEDLADGFAARLFFLADGRLFVMDRLDSKGLHAGLSAPARSQIKTGLKRLSPFETLRNKIEVKVRNHHVYPFTYPLPVAAYTAAWVNAGPVVVEPESYLDIAIKYPDSLGKPYQGSFVRVNSDDPSESSPLQVWSAGDRTGTNMGGATGTGEATFDLITQQIGENSFGLTYVQSGNNQKFCTVRLRNFSTTRTAYFFDLQVQVAGIIETGAALSVISEDAGSQALNGQRDLVINSPWVQSAAMAAGVGQSYLDALADRERASVASVVYQWSGAQLYTNLTTYDLGKFVDFGAAGGPDALANFGLHDHWLIVGQDIQWLSADGQDALVTLTYERRQPLSVLLMGSSNTAAAGAAGLTWAHTVVDGNNRLLVVIVTKRAYAGTALINSMTYGGQALTKLGGVQEGSGDYPRVELWYLVAPNVGTGNISFTLSAGTDNMQVCALDFVNVDQGGPIGSIMYDWGSSGPGVILETAAGGDMVIDGICYRGAAATAGSGQTQQYSGSSDGTWRGSVSTEPGAASVEMRWSVPAGGFAQLAAVINRVV